jgi:anti-anti-sigma factor
MDIQVEQDGTLRRLHIAGDMNIYTAAELKRQLLDALAAAEKLEVHLAQVSELDTAGLQQLLLARREAIRLGKRLRLVELSAAIREVLALCHLHAYFAADGAVSASVSDAERRTEEVLP